MCGINKVDVVCSFLHKFVKKLAQLIGIQFLTSIMPGTDIIILAKDTLQIASGKKNRTGTAFSADARLFPKMKRSPGNVRRSAAFAETGGIISVCPALPWAQRAF